MRWRKSKLSEEKLREILEEVRKLGNRRRRSVRILWTIVLENHNMMYMMYMMYTIRFRQCVWRFGIAFSISILLVDWFFWFIRLHHMYHIHQITLVNNLYLANRRMTRIGILAITNFKSNDLEEEAEGWWNRTGTSCLCVSLMNRFLSMPIQNR
jgi:hypothetical protein